MVGFGSRRREEQDRDVDERRAAEYAALRATIRERGTVRMVLLPVVFIGWAGTTIGAAGVITVAISTLLPLLVLAAGFEAIFALHMNAERIDSYLQVFHESDGGLPAAARGEGSAPDPLFGRLFVLAISVNFLPAALNFEFIAELILLAIPHFVLINRIRVARLAAAGQRAEDLRRFSGLRDGR